MSSRWAETRLRLGARVQSLGRALESPGRIQRKLSGVHIDEDIATLVTRPYLRAASVRTILDVGANEGQFARTVLHLFPAAKVVSFEPLPSVQGALGALAAASGGRLAIEPCALGDRDGRVEFHVNTFSPTSSVLKPDRSIAALGDQVQVTSTIEVPMRRLRDWAAATPLEREILVKLDVQGFEASVLRGAADFLAQVRVVISETTFAPIYQGQATLGELCSLLEPHGLRYREAFGVVRDPASGEPMWQDSVFVRD